MNKFCKRTLILCIPIFIGILSLHLYIDFLPAMFRNKAHFIEQNKNDIEALFLGSSHTQEAINPLWMKNKCSNLAYNSQDVVANCMLFDKYVDELPNLKFVFFEFEYFTLEQPLDQSEVNAPLYRKFYNLPKASVYKQFVSFFSDISFFKDYTFECWKYMKGNYQVNEAGYVTQSDYNPFGELGHDSTLVCKTAPERLITRHKKRYISEIPVNEVLIDSLIAKATRKNIEVVFLALPKYKTYIEREIPDKLQIRNSYLNKKLTNNEVLYFDYERDLRFADVNLYLDDNHLGHEGAVKFTAVIDSLIGTLK